MIYRPDVITLKEDIYLDGGGRRVAKAADGARLIAQAGLSYRREALLEYVTDEVVEAVRVKEVRTDYYLGVSFGAPGAPSGVALVEREAERLPDGVLVSPAYRVRGLKSHPAEMTYRALAADVGERLSKSPAGPYVVCDWTDVGSRTFWDFAALLENLATPFGVRVTPDSHPSRDDLIATAVALFEADELKVDEGLITRFRFDAALRSFTRRRPGAGADPFALKERDGDELVIAALLSLYYASHPNALNPARWL